MKNRHCNKIDKSQIGMRWSATINGKTRRGHVTDSMFNDDGTITFSYNANSYCESADSDDTNWDGDWVVQDVVLRPPAVSRTQIAIEKLNVGDQFIYGPGVHRCWMIVDSVTIVPSTAEVTVWAKQSEEGKVFDVVAKLGTIVRKRGSNVKKMLKESPRYVSLKNEAQELGGKGFCGPLAYAVLTECSMKEAFGALKTYNPKGGGTYTVDLVSTLKKNGWRLEELTVDYFNSLYPIGKYEFKHVTSRHPERYKKVWPKGKFLMQSSGHFFTVIDGETIDFTVNRSYQAQRIWRVRPADDNSITIWSSKA